MSIIINRIVNQLRDANVAQQACALRSAQSAQKLEDRPVNVVKSQW